MPDEAEEKARIFCPHDSNRCGYKCPFHEKGAVLNRCSKYGEALRYDGNIPPLRLVACMRDTGK